MADVKIIKKYPNRCLYDTSRSKYISLVDLKDLVLSNEPFEVREAKTDKDITRQVLLQIIAEEENEGNPLFTTDMLMKFIRMYGESMQGAFSNYMEESLEFFESQTRQFWEHFGQSHDTNPMSAWADMAKRNMEAWQDAQKQIFGGGSFPSATGQPAKPKPASKKS